MAYPPTEVLSKINLMWIISVIIIQECSCLGRHAGFGASELCEVNSRTKISEGYRIAGRDQCEQFCHMTRGCSWWTWYGQVIEDEVTKDNVCFALNNCELVAQKCDNCVSGKKKNGKSTYHPNRRHQDL